jgi:hypothetical protein
MPKIEIELPELPEGKEYTGEYRPLRAGEQYYNYDSKHCFTWRLSYCKYDYHIVRDVRWRAVVDGVYYRIDLDKLTVETDIDDRCASDGRRWESGNYFRDRHVAVSTAKDIQTLLNNAHKT